MRTIRLKKLLFTIVALFAASMTSNAQLLVLEGDLYNRDANGGQGGMECHYYLYSDRSLVLQAVSTEDKEYFGRFSENNLWVSVSTSKNDGFKNLMNNRNVVEKIIVSTGIKNLGHQVIGYSNALGIFFPNLKSVEIDPDFEGEIPSEFLKDFTTLESVTFYQKNVTIGQYAFSGCKALKSFYALQGISSIGSGAFSGCSSLETFSLPSNNSLTTTPSSYAFNNCDNLKYIDLRNASFTQCGDIGVPDHTMPATAVSGGRITSSWTDSARTAASMRERPQGTPTRAPAPRRC